VKWNKKGDKKTQFSIELNDVSYRYRDGMKACVRDLNL
jgi:hypothetical protein